MKHYQADQRDIVQPPMQEALDMTTVTVQHPVTGAVQAIPVRRVGPIPRDLVRQVISENREAIEQLAPYDGSASGG